MFFYESGGQNATGCQRDHRAALSVSHSLSPPFYLSPQRETTTLPLCISLSFSTDNVIVKSSIPRCQPAEPNRSFHLFLLSYFLVPLAALHFLVNRLING